MIEIKYNKNYGKWFINDVLRAIKRFSLIEHNDSVAVALSGGKDSTTLLYILSYLKKYSKLSFSLVAIHVKVDEYQTSALRSYCEFLKVPYYEELLRTETHDTMENCYICSRLKRGAISAIMNSAGVPKVAFGHHATDVAETFMMNIIDNKKLGALTPKVQIEDSSIIIIRPMIYLEEDRITKIFNTLNLPDNDISCPYRKTTRRDIFKQIMSCINEIQSEKNFERNVVEALEKSPLEDWREQ